MFISFRVGGDINAYVHLAKTTAFEQVVGPVFMYAIYPRSFF